MRSRARRSPRSGCSAPASARRCSPPVSASPGAARAFDADGRGLGLRAVVLLLGLTSILFALVLGLAPGFGLSVRGFTLPIGVDLVAGAALFGLGMAIAGACASGAMAALGTGALKMMLAVLAMIAGATAAAFTVETWSVGAALPAVSLPETVGRLPALALTLAALALLWAVLAAVERRRTGALAPLFAPGPGRRLALGAGLIAVLAAATLLVAGRPWLIVMPFTTWGGLGIEAAGLDDPVFWPWFERGAMADALHRPLLADGASVMNFGLIAGALIAGGLSGGFGRSLRLPVGQALAAVLGGLAMGFGAMMATGCNVSGLLAGIASGSLHGWVWLAAAAAGATLGHRLRRLFG